MAFNNVLTGRTKKRTSTAKERDDIIVATTPRKMRPEVPNPENDPEPETKVSWWKRSSEILATAKEQQDIRQARRGDWVGEDSWVDTGTERSTPLPIPRSLDLDKLQGPQLRVAVSLGYLSLDTMTRDQLTLFRAATRTEEIASARSFISALQRAEAQDIEGKK